MTLRIVGAGLPRTGTSSLRMALEQLLGGACCHMSALPGHPFDLGAGWQQALDSGTTDWDALMSPYVAAVDWPASAFWRELSDANPDAPVLLSQRDSAQTWYGSVEATILPVARETYAPDWSGGRDLITLFERFTGTKYWDDPQVLMDAYERHNTAVRQTVPPERLIEWKATDGWEPICRALSLPVPDMPFPWTNRREDWG
jgi:hypothetical protein